MHPLNQHTLRELMKQSKEMLEKETHFVSAIFQGLQRMQRFDIFTNLLRLLHDPWGVLTSSLVQFVSSTVTWVNLNCNHVKKNDIESSSPYDSNRYQKSDMKMCSIKYQLKDSPTNQRTQNIASFQNMLHSATFLRGETR